MEEFIFLFPEVWVWMYCNYFTVLRTIKYVLFVF